MSEIATGETLHDQIVDTSQALAGLLSLEFSPIPPEIVHRVNARPENIRDRTFLVSGSRRVMFFHTPDLDDVVVQENFQLITEDGATKDEHNLLVGLPTPPMAGSPTGREMYMVNVNLDDGTLTLEDDNANTVFQPERYPAITKRVIGALSAAVAELTEARRH